MMMNKYPRYITFLGIFLTLINKNFLIFAKKFPSVLRNEKWPLGWIPFAASAPQPLTPSAPHTSPPRFFTILPPRGLEAINS